MDQKIMLEDFQVSEENYEIKQELDDAEFNLADLHHSIDIKEESHVPEFELKEEFDAQECQQLECYACGIKFYTKLLLKKHLKTQCIEKPVDFEYIDLKCPTKHKSNEYVECSAADFDLKKIMKHEENHQTNSIEDKLERDVYDDDEDDTDKKLKNFAEAWTSSEFLRDNVEISYDLPSGTITNFKQQPTKKSYARERPTICPFCYQDVVTHFTRHLFRHHKNNKEVIVIKNLQPRSKERLNLVTALRKQGYFYLNTERNVLNPVRTAKNPNTDYFICTYCLGHYTKNRLYKHVKTCNSKPPDHLKSSKNCLAAAQTYMATVTSKNHEFLRTSRIKQEVFGIMRPDDVSSVAKSDPLICLYGEELLNKYKRQQISIAVSNKIREIARLLIASKALNPEIRGLFDTLKPEMFPILISATKIISGYSEITKCFKAPSLAVHMGSSLRIVCDVAIKIVVEKRNVPNIKWNDGDQKKTELEDLRKLLERYWCSEISSFVLIKARKEKNIQPQHSPTTELQSSVEGGADKQRPIKIKTLSKQEKAVKKGNGRVRWSDIENKLVVNYFGSHIKKKIAPRKHECEILLAQHRDLFVDKDWVKIKAFVYNTFRDK